MLKIFILLMAFPVQALPRSEPNLCGEGIDTKPDALHPIAPHCAPRLQQSTGVLLNG
jgi:hypothetical protein